MRVLVVDDDPIIRRMLRRILEKQTTFTIAGEAHDGSEALDAVRELDPDVILMDIDMPVMDGLRASITIKRIHPEIHILAFTGSSCPETRDQLKRAGVTAVIENKEAAELIYHLNDLAAIRSRGHGSAERDPLPGS